MFFFILVIDMAKNEELEWGKKMIKLSVQFWTNDLPKGSDKKTAWESGAIHVIANKGRGLKHNHLFFRDLKEFMPKMAELLNKNGIRLKQVPKETPDVDLSKL
jgi:hypothetical protein